MPDPDPGVAVPENPEPGGSWRAPAAIFGGLALAAGLIALLAAVLRSGDGPGVEAALQAFVGAAARGDGVAFQNHFHFERFADRAQEVGYLDKSVAPDDRNTFINGAREGLAGVCHRTKGTDRQWVSIRVTRIRQASSSEAEAFGFIRQGGREVRFRFWLATQREEWKVYDWELLEDALRISRFVSAMVSEGAGSVMPSPQLKSATERVRKAMALGAAGRQAEAIEYLESARTHTRSEEQLEQLDRLEAEYQWTRGFPKEALEAADRGLARGLGDPMLHLFRAEALYDLDRFEEGRAAARAFLDRFGEDGAAYNVVGRCLAELGKQGEAVKAWRSGIAADPDDYVNRFSLAHALLKQGQPSRARALFIESCRRAPPSMGYFEAAAPELAARGAYHVLVTLAEDQGGRHPKDTHAAFYRGFAHRRLENYEQAERALRQGLKEPSDENRPGLISELALTLAQAKRSEEAHALAEEVEKDDELWGEYLHTCFEALEGKRDEALGSLRFVLRADPSYHRDVEWEPIFVPYLEEGDFAALVSEARAKAEFDEALRAAMGREAWEKALRIAEARTAQVPGDADGWYYRGMALKHLERYPEARKALEEGERLVGEREKPSFWRQTALVLARQGSFAKAHAFADRLIASGPVQPSGYHARAVVFALEGKKEEAAGAVVMLLERYPDWKPAVLRQPALAEARTHPSVRPLLGDE